LGLGVPAISWFEERSLYFLVPFFILLAILGIVIVIDHRRKLATI